MEQKQITLEQIYHRLQAIEATLRARGIAINKVIKEDDEGELTEEIKSLLEKRRKSTNYISHEEVKRHIFAKK